MRKSIPVAFFSLMSTLLIFGTVVMEIGRAHV